MVACIYVENRIHPVIVQIRETQEIRTYTKEVVCPSCGKVFVAKIDLSTQNTIQGEYCHTCYLKERDKRFNNLVKHTDFLAFIEIHKEVIQKVCLSYLKNPFRDYNLTYQDIQHEARISLLDFYARKTYYNENPLAYGSGVIGRVVKSHLYWHDFRRRQVLQHFKDDMESLSTEFAVGRVSAMVFEHYNPDKLLDIRSMLSKIKKLALTDIDVMRTLKYAYDFNSQMLNNESSMTKPELQKYHTSVRKGIQKIIHNDITNINDYIDFKNLRAKFDLDKDPSELYGYRTCEDCGAKFVMSGNTTRCPICRTKHHYEITSSRESKNYTYKRNKESRRKSIQAIDDFWGTDLNENQ